ncbi:hypothetical protein ACWD0E_29075 [Streptomyces sp. NPDC003002]
MTAPPGTPPPLPPLAGGRAGAGAQRPRRDTGLHPLRAGAEERGR